MTDFVHEGPKDPNKPPVPGEEKPTTERERMKKVYTYVAVLFTVAFLLILWTFLMNQRSSREIRDEIRSGNNTLQSTLDENQALTDRITELEEQLAAAQELSDKIGRTCRIVSGKKKGRIELDYYGMDDLNDLLEALAAIKRRKNGGDEA